MEAFGSGFPDYIPDREREKAHSQGLCPSSLSLIDIPKVILSTIADSCQPHTAHCLSDLLFFRRT